MSLRVLSLKKAYDSTKDDVLEEFYIPVLANSVKYYRLTGFFSSSALAIAAKGISGLIKNGGTMKIVTSPILSKEDVEAIIEGHRSLEDAVSNSLLRELNIIEDIEDLLLRDHVRALSWLIANKKLDIRIVIPMQDGIPLTKDEIVRRGIFHQKVGIFSMKRGTSFLLVDR